MDRGRGPASWWEWADAKGDFSTSTMPRSLPPSAARRPSSPFRSDGVILEANENLLKTTGYGVEEIWASPTGCSWTRAARTRRAYANLWLALRRGELQAGHSGASARATARSGSEATYNPILDANGKVAKVVKFATDITAQVRLFTDLKTMIATRTSARSTRRSATPPKARSASWRRMRPRATFRWSPRRAEELAASIGEIARPWPVRAAPRTMRLRADRRRVGRARRRWPPPRGR